MKPIITTNASWGYLKNSSLLPDLDYNKMEKIQLKDMRKTSQQKLDEKDITEDYKDVCKKSMIPLPGYSDYWDDTSSESVAPRSDWQGPTGDSWIGK